MTNGSDLNRLKSKNFFSTGVEIYLIYLSTKQKSYAYQWLKVAQDSDSWIC